MPRRRAYTIHYRLATGRSRDSRYYLPPIFFLAAAIITDAPRRRSHHYGRSKPTSRPHAWSRDAPEYFFLNVGGRRHGVSFALSKSMAGVGLGPCLSHYHAYAACSPLPLASPKVNISRGRNMILISLAMTLCFLMATDYAIDGVATCASIYGRYAPEVPDDLEAG